MVRVIISTHVENDKGGNLLTASDFVCVPGRDFEEWTTIDGVRTILISGVPVQ